MKKVQQKLTLSRETVRTLNAPKNPKDSRQQLPTTTVLTKYNTCTCL